MKQTAVKWLVSKLTYITEDNRYIDDSCDDITDIVNQAIQMEKEQMENFFKAGVKYGAGSVFATEWGEDTDELNFEQYYNETFKQ